jgi:hypothetical protein
VSPRPSIMERHDGIGVESNKDYHRLVPHLQLPTSTLLKEDSSTPSLSWYAVVPLYPTRSARRLVKHSPLGLAKCKTFPSSLNMLTSSTPLTAVTLSFFKAA